MPFAPKYFSMYSKNEHIALPHTIIKFRRLHVNAILNNTQFIFNIHQLSLKKMSFREVFVPIQEFALHCIYLAHLFRLL